MNFDGKYELVGLLATAPEAITFRARDLASGDEVFVHIVSGADRSLFSIAPSSASIVRILDKSESAGGAYIVTNAVPGFTSLREAVARQRIAPPAAPPARPPATPPAAPPAAPASEPSDFTRKFGVPAQAEPGEFTQAFQARNAPPANYVEPAPAETVLQPAVPPPPKKVEEPEADPAPLTLDLSPVDDPPAAGPTIRYTGDPPPRELEKLGKFRIPDAAIPAASTIKAPPPAAVPPPLASPTFTTSVPPPAFQPPAKVNTPPPQGSDSGTGEFTRLFHPPAPAGESHGRSGRLTDKTQERDWAPQLNWQDTESESSGATGVFMPPAAPRQPTNHMAGSGPSEFTQIISPRRTVVEQKPDAFNVAPPPQAPSPEPLPKPRSNLPLILAIVGLMLLAVLIVLYFAFAGA